MAQSADQVQISKHLLSFPLPPDPFSTTETPPSDVLHLTNPSPDAMAFKVKTTNQNRYIVRPNSGLLPPTSNLAIHIFLNPPFPTNPGPSKDKLLLMVVPIPPPAPTALSLDFWADHEQDPLVLKTKLKVHFDGPAAPPTAEIPTPPDPSSPPAAPLVSPPAATSNPLPVVTTPTLNPPPSTTSHPSPSPTTPPANPDDPEDLMHERNYDAALDRARELQRLMEAKNLELARLRMELAETKAESERVLKDAPKLPVGGGGGWGDPMGGVGLVGWGVMGLFAIILLVNLYKVY
eukprot:GFKZ01005718.1.p1 GENE.GFKZ01005718.1~~GFKZ01005718.1.p1  ORF type:complete len:299 (+),score=53.68 GFKZ01005718.1:24-899(+)